MDWIFLSPHPDDVALSCGGLVWELGQTGQAASLWTICAGEPPAGQLSVFAQELHQRWESSAQAVLERRREDVAACRELGATYRPFSIPDCVYRRGPQGEWLYPTVMDIFGSVHPAEQTLVEELRIEISANLPAGCQVVCPLALGNHVDHQVTRLAAEHLDLPLLYYADYPYLLQDPVQLERLADEGWRAQVFAVSEAGLEAWQRSVAAHASQMSTFWPDLDAMRRDLQAYWQRSQGVRLWREPFG